MIQKVMTNDVIIDERSAEWCGGRAGVGVKYTNAMRYRHSTKHVGGTVEVCTVRMRHAAFAEGWHLSKRLAQTACG